MSNFYIQFIKEIILPKYDKLESIAFDGNKISATNKDGNKIYYIATSGVVLKEIPLSENINFITYQFMSNSFLGYNNQLEDIISNYDANFNKIGEINLDFDPTKFIPIQNITYNYQNNTISLTYMQNINVITSDGEVCNNLNTKKSKYNTSNLSGAYMIYSITTNGRNIIAKSDLSGNILEHYQTPKNILIEDISIIKGGANKSTYYALGFLNNKNYLLKMCLNHKPQTKRNTNYTYDGFTAANPNVLNPYYTSVNQGYSNIPNFVNYPFCNSFYNSPIPTTAYPNNAFANYPNTIATSPVQQSSSFGFLASFSSLLFYFLRDTGAQDNSSTCDDMGLMMMILALVYCFRCKDKDDTENDCNQNVYDQAYYENLKNLNISAEYSHPYGYYYNDNNPII